jgi:integrase/recombinase XerD
LCSLFSFALKTGYLDKNPALALENLKTPDRLFSKVLSRPQIERLILIEKNLRNKLMLKILYFTGIRVDELSHLKVNSLQNSENGWIMIVIGKGRKVRSIRLPDHLSAEISDYIINLDSADCLFTNDRRVDFGINDFSRTPLSNSQIFRIVKTAAKNAGLDIQPSPHWLRHTSATHAIENGAPVHVVQRSLGHESISTTGRYLEIRPKESVGDYIKPI